MSVVKSKYGGGLVVKSNPLIKASYRLTLNESRLVLLGITKIRRDRKVSEEMFRVTAAEYADAFGVGLGVAYRDLAAAANRLFTRHLKIEGHIDQTRWVQACNYRDRTKDPSGRGGYVEFRFAYDILPHLTELGDGNFTKYLIDEVRGFSNKYSIRMYDLAVEVLNKGYRKTFKITVDEIRYIFAIEEGKYKLTADLKLNVLDKPIKEINSQSNNFKLEVEPVRAGRKVVSFLFKIQENKKAAKPTPTTTPATTPTTTPTATPTTTPTTTPATTIKPSPRTAAFIREAQDYIGG